MGATRDVVYEERLIRRGGIEPLYVRDGLVRQVGGEVVAGLPDPGKNLRHVLEEVRGPLVGLASQEAIEVLEAHADGPLIEWASRAVLIAWRVVVLSEPGCRVAVLLQDRADRGVLLA